MSVSDVVAPQSLGSSAQPNSYARSPSQEHSKIDEQEWAVVDSPENEPETHYGEMSGSLEFYLGWGTWRFTLFSWKMNIRTEHTHDNNDRETNNREIDGSAQ